MFSTEVVYVLASLATVALAILLYIKVLPKKLDGTFDNKFLQFLHDFFHFKKLYLEEVLKAIFIVATIGCVCLGAFLLLGYEEVYHYSYYTGSSIEKESTFGYGLAILIGGPIVLRLAYEAVLMFILLVKHVMEINGKLKAPKEETPAANDKNF